MEMRVDGKDISSLRVVDLKAELDKRGQSKSGTKKELVERLSTYLLNHPEDPGNYADDDNSEESNSRESLYDHDRFAQEQAEAQARLEQERKEKEDEEE